MRYSRYFLKTEKKVSDDEVSASARLLKQGGFIRESVAGRYYILPMGQRVQQRVMRVVREEMDRVGAHEMISPILHPLELWKETNRTNTAGFELMKVKDRRGADFALGGTAEEMFVDLVRQYKLSYRDLPFHIYQFSPKFRDELRARGGLLRVREFIMKDGYSFHRGEEDFKEEYEKMKTVYTRIFERLGLDTVIVESDNGYIGGEYCHEYIVESEAGESTYFIAENGSYAAHEDVAVFKKEPKNINEEMRVIQTVDAKRGPTMEDGVSLHKLPLWQQIKDMLYVDNLGRYILAVIRGDLSVNETKLQNAIRAISLRSATEEEIRDIIGSEPGFISPVGIRDRVKQNTEFLIVADDSLRGVINMYGGSNEINKDLLNVNIDRDWKADIEKDIALAEEGYMTRGDQGKLIKKRGIEVGNIFQLGTHYSQKMKGAIYTDADGKTKPFYMGCYGIGIGRTMATIVEKYHDDKGILWPEITAPFAIHLIALDGAKEQGDKLYENLIHAGKEVFYDDRDKGAGEKFADADLLGIPIRIVISKKTMELNACEIKRRNETKATIVDMDKVLVNL